MVRVKICGITNLEDALSAIELGADALGFHVELEDSKCPISAANAAEIISRLPPYVATVIVTSASEPSRVVRLAEKTRANTIQFHGEAPLAAMRAVREKLPYLKTYRVVHVFGEDAISESKQFEDAADAIILDSKDIETGARGGTGKTHDWTISRKIVEAISLPVILAGGLNPENVAEAIRVVRPYAVDVESGISNPDGTKDLEKMKAFVERAKESEM